MSENVDDLYTKGYQAYSSKDFAKAKAFWEEVLSHDPNHEKAKRGLAELQKLKTTRKRSSKEVLQEIKRLYGAKKYRESLKLCDMLLRKYPKNEDLQGLRKKIAARVKQLDASLQASNEEGHDAGESNLESTMVLTQKAEAFVNAASKGDESSSGGDALSQKIEALIQAGVSSYEAQDYPNALKFWEEALALDPDNRIVRDYISSVKEQMAQGDADESANDTSDKPNKDQMLEAYNQGLAAYQDKRFDAAMERWNYILEHYPNHKETQQCLEKTQRAIEAHKQGREDLDKARKLLASGKAEEAETIANKLQSDVPDLEGLAALQEAIEKRKQQINEIRTLELEEKGTNTDASYSASDDEITQYFTPGNETETEARQVTRVISVKKEKAPFNWKLWILTPGLLAVLAIGGYLFYDYQQKQLKTTDSLSSIRLPVQEVSWNSPEQKAQDFFDMASDFYQSGEFALAVLGYERALQISNDRLSEINAIAPDQMRLEVTKEKDSLGRLVAQASEEKAQAQKSLQTAEVVEAEIKEAKRALERGQLEEARPVLVGAILNNPGDQELRRILADSFEAKGFEEINNQELSEALQHFRRAAALHPAFEQPRRHTEVIERFFRGDITAVEKDQWFFFFQNS